MVGEYREEDLDVLILDAENQKYKLYFRPFAISSGSLFVRDLRNHAAKQLNVKARKVRLKYNGQELNEDHRTAKYHGVERNSTVSCTLSKVSGNPPTSTSCTNGRTTAGEAAALELNFNTAPEVTLPISTQELRHSTTDFPGLYGLSTDVHVPRRACAPIFISHEPSSPQSSVHKLELSSYYTTTESGASSTDFTSVEGELDHKAAGSEAKTTIDAETAEGIFTSMGDHLQDEDVSFPSAGMSETLEIRQDLSIAHREASPFNLTKFFLRLIDVGSFLENGNIKLVATPDYRAARYMIFDWYDASAEALWTAKQNLVQRTLGGTFSKLPEGLRTAIVTSRAFGIRYMWIPTICTITDDEVDIKRQNLSMDGIFYHAVGLLKTPGSVGHQYIDAKIMQYQIRVIELPECINTSSAPVHSPKLGLERYLASRDDPWTTYPHTEATDRFWPGLETCLALEQLEAVFREGSGSSPSPQPLLPERLSVANLDAKRSGYKLIDTSFTKDGVEVSKAQLLPVHSPRFSSLAFRPKDGQVSRHKNSPSPQEVDSPAGGLGEQPVRLRAGQRKRTLANTANEDQSFDDLGNDGVANACTDTISRKRKRQHGCAMKCPWCFADLGTDGPGCPRHICERQRHPNVKHFKGYHGKNEDHHHYSSDDMRVPSRPGASEREKMVYLIFKLVHGWNPILQPLKDFLTNNQHILVPNPYLTKANGECVACDAVEHSDHWRLPEAAFVSMTIADERPGPNAALRLARVDSRVEDPLLPHELDTIPNFTQHSRFNHMPQSKPTYVVPIAPQSPVNCMAAQPYLIPMNRYPSLPPSHRPEITEHGRLHWEAATPHPDGPTLHAMRPVSPFWNQTFNEAPSHAQRMQPAPVFTGIAQPIGQDDQADMSEAAHTTFFDSEGGQLAGDHLIRNSQSTQALRTCETGHEGPGPDVRQEISEDSSENTASEDSSAEEADANTEPTSMTVPSAKDEKAPQKGVYVPIKICICNDCPMDLDHGHLKCHRNPFCHCCNSFKAYSEEGRRFLEKAGETRVCFCEDYLWPQEKHAQCHGKDYCNCCKKWRAYSEEGRSRLNHLMLQLAARAADLVPMEAWCNAPEVPKQLEQIQQEQRKAAKGKKAVH